MSETTHNGAESVPMQVSPEAAEKYRTALLALMPGLIGGIDQAMKEQMGHNVAFVLVTFGPGGASYATNIKDTDVMKQAMRDIVVSWYDTEDEEVVPAPTLGELSGH